MTYRVDHRLALPIATQLLLRKLAFTYYREPNVEPEVAIFDLASTDAGAEIVIDTAVKYGMKCEVASHASLGGGRD